MTNDSERREVAYLARALAENEFDFECDNVAKAIGANRHFPAQAWGRLADLIEPQPERTCEVESSHEHESDGCYSWFEYELSCGHQVKSDCQLPPNYCPECGKKVEYNARNYI